MPASTPNTIENLKFPSSFKSASFGLSVLLAITKRLDLIKFNNVIKLAYLTSRQYMSYSSLSKNLIISPDLYDTFELFDDIIF